MVADSRVIQERRRGLGLYGPLRERFFMRCGRGTDEECWPWQGYRDDEGYGTISVGQTFKRAHRVAYELMVGPIPEGLTLDHLCRTRACVNPWHLEPTTIGENVARSSIQPSVINRRKTECKRGHLLAGDNVRHCVRRNTGRPFRRCVTCERGRLWRVAA